MGTRVPRSFLVHYLFANEIKLLFLKLTTDDDAKDVGEELFTEIHAFFDRIPKNSSKLRHTNRMDLSKKFLAAIFSVIAYCIIFGCQISHGPKRNVEFSLLIQTPCQHLSNFWTSRSVILPEKNLLSKLAFH